MTTYTVYNPSSGTVYERGVTAEEAMHTILTYDGYRYEIRRGEITGTPTWDLWHSSGSENSFGGARRMVKTVVFSMEEDEKAARADIAQQVINAGWERLPECVSDEDYDLYHAPVEDEQP